MSDFQQYLLKQAESQKAYSDYNAASLKLENARIHCRLAELKSQHEPLASAITDIFGPDLGMEQTQQRRAELYAVAFWVVVGRKP